MIYKCVGCGNQKTGSPYHAYYTRPWRYCPLCTARIDRRMRERFPRRSLSNIFLRALVAKQVNAADLKSAA